MTSWYKSREVIFCLLGLKHPKIHITASKAVTLSWLPVSPFDL